MTKLEKLLNEYYATEGLTLSEHLSEIREEVDTYDVVNELVSLLSWLNKEIN